MSILDAIQQNDGTALKGMINAGLQVSLEHLISAIAHNKADMVELLIRYAGVNPKIHCLLMAIKMNNAKVVKHLVSLGGLNVTPEILSLAILSNNAKMILNLIRFSAVSVSRKHLSEAIRLNFSGVVCQLIRFGGVSVVAQDLCKAIMTGAADMVFYLVRHGGAKLSVDGLISAIREPDEQILQYVKSCHNFESIVKEVNPFLLMEAINAFVPLRSNKWHVLGDESIFLAQKKVHAIAEVRKNSRLLYQGRYNRIQRNFFKSIPDSICLEISQLTPNTVLYRGGEAEYFAWKHFNRPEACSLTDGLSL
jgi:hypothetical protein